MSDNKHISINEDADNLKKDWNTLGEDWKRVYGRLIDNLLNNNTEEETKEEFNVNIKWD